MSIGTYLMPPRPDWNVQGPKLPAWFRMRLKKVDPALVLQFMPPRSLRCPKGTDPSKHPHGVWAICRKMKNNGWLFKRWTWSLNDEFGMFQPPGFDTIRVLTLARDCWRQNRLEVLENQLDKKVAEFRMAKTDASRARLKEHIQCVMRDNDMIAGKSHCAMRSSPLAVG